MGGAHGIHKCLTMLVEVVADIYFMQTLEWYKKYIMGGSEFLARNFWISFLCTKWITTYNKQIKLKYTLLKQMNIMAAIFLLYSHLRKNKEKFYDALISLDGDANYFI